MNFIIGVLLFIALLLALNNILVLIPKDLKKISQQLEDIIELNKQILNK